MVPVVQRAVKKTTGKKHNPQWEDAFDLADKARQKLEKGKAKVSFSKAHKIVSDVYWKAGKGGKGGGHGNVFPGFSRHLIEPMDNQSSQRQG